MTDILTPPVADTERAFADYFRDADITQASMLAWRLERQGAVVDALRGLCHGPSGLVRLRLWVLLTLLQHGEAQLSREQLDTLFYQVRPDALDTVLKRLREIQLLAWDDSQRRTSLTPLAQQLSGLLGPLLAQAPLPDDEPALADAGLDGGELASLLGQVVGADQLGTLDVSQVQMLLAQLGRLHGEFAEAMASGSEFRLRAARQRYDSAQSLIDRASGAISALIGHAQGHAALEKAARALGQAQGRLLAMASQFNRAMQQVDRQRVTLGTTGVTSTDVKRWLQTLPRPEDLVLGALSQPLHPVALAPHELLDVTEAEFERDRPQVGTPDPLPPAQAAPSGTLTAVALPRELAELAALLADWDRAAAPDATHPVVDALLGPSPDTTRYAQVAYKTQLLPLLGDAQARELPGATGELARQPWRVAWAPTTQRVQHPDIERLSRGHLVHAASPESDPDTAP